MTMASYDEIVLKRWGPIRLLKSSLYPLRAAHFQRRWGPFGVEFWRYCPEVKRNLMLRFGYPGKGVWTISFVSYGIEVFKTGW
jgi:hypothetical protein